jgi:hypothetical protein
MLRELLEVCWVAMRALLPCTLLLFAPSAPYFS